MQEEAKRGNRINHPTKKLFAKRYLPRFCVTIDEYTHDLIMQAIDEGKGMSKVQVINKGMCSLLGIAWKDDEQLHMEKRLEYILQSSSIKTQEEIEDAILNQAKEISRIRQERTQKKELSTEEMDIIRKTQEIADEKLKRDTPIKDAMRKQSDELQANRAKSELEMKKKNGDAGEI